ncbi:hypothetical protein KC207_14015 [Phycicoccus sp. BSK3Z-2]|uniref:Transglutaminase-like domain-containing protein n=1 Tax=Phycicoccus avicenniae TaxID=2828860 RepID=A0A941DA90_9MICO|nr:transglutaminaseTgpA domain-containing protein [Phycicoccus avicenniae]MBR7744406.1 hypothetical protein [Phycicoccus avicenniae]
MSRLRPLDALLAALATLAVTLPLSGLFAPAGAWVRPSVLLVVVVALVGVGLRSLATARPLVVLGQLVALVLSGALLHGRGHLLGGVLPSRETGEAIGILLGEAYTVVTTYAAPAPSERGVVVAVSLLVGLTAVVVDGLAVTYRSPAVAGIPLLAAFLASATNTSTGLAAWYVVPPALCWLALVATQGVSSLRAWGGTPTRDGRSDPAGSFGSLARGVGLVALAAAVVVPGLVPHLPTTFVADGLARGDGRGNGSGPVLLSTSIDVARDLADQSDAEVLRYRTSASEPVPLRVGLLDTYRGGRWSAADDVTFVPPDNALPGPAADGDVERTTERIEVLDSGIAVPQVALPATAVGSPFPTGTWRLTVSGVPELTSRVPEYTAEYTDLEPTPEQFGSFSDLDRSAGDLRVDPDAEDAVEALLADVVEESDADTPFEVAVAIQDRLRSTAYSYSEELAEETAAGQRSEEPLVRFLETRTGYCVQFSSAMIMAARAAGIPARMAVGYLPGTVDGDERVVIASDAHAWPELYFPRLGWTRFEPTPGARTGLAPSYTREVGPATDNALPVPTPSATSSAPTPDRPQEDVPAGDTADDVGTVDTGLADVVARSWPTVAGVAAVLVLAALTPLGAWLARRRARRRARDDAERVEAEWQSLLLGLGDVGYVPSEGATPRETSRQITRAAYLTPEEQEAFGRVVDTLERARYARPGADLPEVAEDARTVRRGAVGRRRRLDRARALLLPEEGRRHWRSLVGRRRDEG